MRAFLETDRLVLRPFTTDDTDLVAELDSDPEVMRYLTGGRPTSRDDIVATALPRLTRRYPPWDLPGYWAALEKPGGLFLGWFEFRPLDGEGGGPLVVELGYRLGRAAWGRGFATEGARALVEKGFAELDVQRVTATTMAVNTRSRRVMEKTGLTFERVFSGDWPDPIPGSEHGEVEYQLTRADWERTRT